MKKVFSLVVVLSVILASVFVSLSYADTRQLPGVYTLIYRGNTAGDVLETLGDVYTFTVSGSVSLVGQTTGSVIKLHTGAMSLPMDVYNVIASGAYRFTITGHFDKKVLQGQVSISDGQSKDFSIPAFDGVLYVYVTYSGQDVSISLLKGDGSPVKTVKGQDGYALLTAWLSQGNYAVRLTSSGGADVQYTVAYTPQDEYSVAPHGVYKTKVVCIASCDLDGDTIRVNVLGKEAKVRVIGVNTPEIAHNGNPAQCYGNEARDFTDSHLNGRWIYLQFDNEIYDKYHRYLAYVWLTYPELYAPDSGYMWNAVLARDGYAKVLSLMPNVQYAWLFSRLQYEAMKAHRGLWGACENP